MIRSNTKIYSGKDSRHKHNCGFQRFQDGGFDADTIKELPDAWLDQSADQDPRYGNWLESVYISWGEKVMPDVLAELIDGEAEMLIEQAFTDMIYDFPRMQLLTEITFLRQKIRRLETEQHVLFPHRTVKRDQRMRRNVSLRHFIFQKGSMNMIYGCKKFGRSSLTAYRRRR